MMTSKTGAAAVLAAVLVMLSFCCLLLHAVVAHAGESALENARALIAALPADPDDVSESDREAIEQAEAAYLALPEQDQKVLDEEEYQKEQSYGRWLESAVWGLAAKTERVDNSTDLADGDYSAYISSVSSMGKSTSKRARSWSVAKLTVRNGALEAVVQCDSGSAFRRMRLAGIDYTARFVNGVPEFTVPVQANVNLKFTVDASDIADSIAYEIEVRMDLAKATKAQIAHAKVISTSARKSVKGSWTQASAQRVRDAAQALAAVASKPGVKRVELALYEDKLSAAQRAVRTKTARQDADDRAARTGAAVVTSSGGDSDEGGQGPASKSDGASERNSDGGGSGKAAVEVKDTDASGAPSDLPASPAESGPNLPLLVGLVALLLFVLGMVIRTLVFNRMMGHPEGKGDA